MSLNKKKIKIFGAGHRTAISHLRSRLIFLTIPLQQDTSSLEMEEAYRISQERAEIAWLQQSKGEKNSERNTLHALSCTLQCLHQKMRTQD